TGNLYPFIARQAPQGAPALSFLQDRYTEIEAWRAEVREYLRSLLLFAPEAVELGPELTDHTDYDDYVIQKWYVTPSPGERMPLILLLPRGDGPFPAVVGLHDHGAQYYFGKRKLVAEEGEPAMLTQMRQRGYDGVPIANELARRGYVVAVIDAFYFGERRLSVPPPPELQPEFLLAAEGSEHWIDLLDRVSAAMESTVAKSLFWAGVTWPGILVWDDMRTVDFLLTRPEVDPARVGCIGLSMGGMRAALLGALDPRVSATGIVGWMSALTDMLPEHAGLHSWCNFIPGLTRVLDWPDVAALHAPNPLLVLQGSQDALFPLDGFQKAAAHLRAVYAKAGVPGRLDIRLFDLPHAFTRDMQEVAWSFFAKALGGR
ncbi:MAG TPA: alpha/beta hydrolase family protein, partial [Armatimonadota bacterium]|nr:alpha/beta hydrolase family protein [Armatimonadota bacterium]